MKRTIVGSSSLSRIKNASVAMLFLFAYTLSAALPFVAMGEATAAPVCQVDTAGANDEPNQKDLTRMCVDYAGAPTSVTTTWNWDDLGTNGSNTMDACSLFDTDGDGNANYSVCVSTNNTPATFSSVTVYSCADNSVNKCFGNTVVSSGGTSCSVSQQSNDPFPAGDDYPLDTQGTCTIPLAAVGGGSAELIDVCSYPSSTPNSDPSDCVMYRDNSARIEVRKVVDPASDPGLFNLRINSTTYAANVGNGGTTGELIFTSGAIVVAETAGTNTALSGYSTSVVCRNQNGMGTVIAQSNPNGATSRQMTITAADASDVVCVFTNTLQTGTVTLVKEVINNNGGTLGVNDFGLSVDGQPVSSGQQTTHPTGVPVVIDEAGATGYGFVSISGVGCPSQLGGTVTPVNGQDITCTITNDDQPGTLIVNKTVVNDNGGQKLAQDFQYQVNGGTATYFESDGSNSMPVNAGTYNVTEVADNGYAVSYDGCTNVQIPVGGTATCTITNDDKPATLVLQKTVVNDHGGLKTANDFLVFIGATQSTWGSNVVNAGTYNVSETPDPNYTASVWGGDCDAQGNVTVATGETKTCTITNDDKPAMISGTKFEVHTGATDGTGATGLPNWTICLDVNQNGTCDTGEPTTVTDAQGNYSFTDLSVGSYGLLETGMGGSMAGWTQIFGPQPVTLTLGQSSEDNDFGNFKNGSISGHKWNDVNGDAQEGADENRLNGWTIQLKDQTGAVVDTDVTSDNGSYYFGNLAPGTYTVCEVQQANWDQTYPLEDGCHTVVIDKSGEQNLDQNFGNQGFGQIRVLKDVDVDGDGDVDYENVNDWQWNVDGGSNMATGTTLSVVAGTHVVSEVQKENYHFTEVECTGETNLPQREEVSVTVSPGETVVCAFVNTRDTGWVRVEKQLYPNNDDGAFDLLVDDEVEREDARDGDDTGWVRVVTGEHTLSEQAGTDTDLSNYDSYYYCNNDIDVQRSLLGDSDGGDYGRGTSVEVDVEENQYRDCVFVNVRRAVLTIEKDAVPNDAQDFSFTLQKSSDPRADDEELLNRDSTVDFMALMGDQKRWDGESTWSKASNFVLDDDSDPTLSNQKEFELRKGWYVVKETPVDGWDLTDIECDDSKWVVEDNMLYVLLQPGAEVHCTFTNTKRATVTVVKDAQPNAAQSFSFVTNFGEEEELFSLTDNGVDAAAARRAFTNVLPGTYTVREGDVEGWTLSSATCSGATVVRTGSELTVSVVPGAEVVCTFVNQKDTVPQVLGAVTTTPHLMDTGTSPLLTAMMSLIVIGFAATVAFGLRRQE